MPSDDRHLVDTDELAAVLRAHEGPPQPAAPQPPRREVRPRRRIRPRWILAASAAALLAGSGLGFGLGSSLTPSGDAAETNAGLGFLPERGWYVVRSRFEATPARPSFAIASNVPLAPLDAEMSRQLTWSGYPIEALHVLKPGGIVILASFSLRGVHAPSDESFPRRTLPLRLRDAQASIRSSGYFPRPDPLGWYQLRAAVGDFNVIVDVYFGRERPSQASIVAAQRQLDQLIVGSRRPATHVADRALPPRPAVPAVSAGPQASRVVDRTFSCAPIAFDGVGDLDISVSPFVDYGTLERAAYLTVRTGGVNPQDNLVIVRPRAKSEIWGGGPGPAGVYASSRRCTPARASLPLSSRGLAEPPTRWEKELDCPVRGRVLVRVRSVLQAPAGWRRVDRFFDGARNPVVSAKLAVRVQRTGKPIAYMEYDAKGAVKLWFSGGCS